MTGAGENKRESAGRALVAEDSAILLSGLEALLADLDIEVIATAPTVDRLRELVEAEPVDIAVLDVNLSGEMVFPVADLLIERGVSIVFATGYQPDKIFPHHLRGHPIMQKPYHPDELRAVLEEAISSAKMRLQKP
jgi:DNA-binding response OmpR family regulator